MSAPSMGQLFEEDSSSDESDAPQTKPSDEAAPAAEEGVAETDAVVPTAGEDGGGGGKTEKTGEGGGGGETKVNEGGEEGKDKDVPDNPPAVVHKTDDSDAEFDDNEEVSGRAATDAERAERERQEEERRRAAEASLAASQEGAESSPEKPVKRQPPRRMGVLDIPRPDQLKRSSNLHMHVTKLPNFVGINPEAYNPDNYDAKAEEEEYRGYVHNMIRWRYQRDPNTGRHIRDENGKLVRESNTRFVKWSDGSYTLHVGEENFEVDDLVSKSVQGFAGLNGYLYLSQKATDPSPDDTEGGEAVAGPTVLECMGRIQSKLIPRPSSLQSEAHKNLTLAVRQRAVKKARIAEVVTQVDPEKEKMARIRNKDDLNRQAARGGRRSGARRGGGGRRPGMNRRYLEAEEEHYDTMNVRDIKYQSRMESMDYGEDSDEDAEDEWSKRKRFQKRSRRGPAGGYAESDSEEQEEEEEEAAFGEDSSDEEDMAKIKAARKKRSHQAVVDEDDD